MRYIEKRNHVEKLRTRAPVNKQTRILISRTKDSPTTVDPATFLSTRTQVFECPKFSPNDLSGLRIGSLMVLGRVDPSEKKRLGWYGSGASFLVRCDCGRYENRRRCEIKKTSKKEYVNACSQCKNIWAEVVRDEFKRTGQWPAGGGPTHRASQIRDDDAALLPPKI